jgi:hypothetical protein
MINRKIINEWGVLYGSLSIFDENNIYVFATEMEVTIHDFKYS